MATDISLTSASRNSLLSLQGTVDLIGRTQGRLSSGLKVAKIEDDAVNFFKAKALNNKADDRLSYKDNIEQGISVIKGTLDAIEAATDLYNLALGLAQEALNANATNAATLQTKARDTLAKADQLFRDAEINGVNLGYFNSAAGQTTLTFDLSENNTFTANGQNLTTVGVGATTGSINFGSLTVQTTIASIEAAISTLETAASTYATDVALLGVNSDFSTGLANTLQEAAGKLTLADLNEEGANLLALQTRQQLGIQSLGFAADSERSILGLF